MPAPLPCCQRPVSMPPAPPALVLTSTFAPHPAGVHKPHQITRETLVTAATTSGGGLPARTGHRYRAGMTPDLAPRCDDTGPRGPDAQGNFNNSQIESLDQNDAQERNAFFSCRSLLPNEGTGLSVTQLQQIQQQNLHNAVKAANCMRAHGVENFPDPAGSTQGSGINWAPVLSAGLTSTRRPMRAAFNVCSGKRVGGPIPPFLAPGYVARPGRRPRPGQRRATKARCRGCWPAVLIGGAGGRCLPQGGRPHGRRHDQATAGAAAQGRVRPTPRAASASPARTRRSRAQP